MAAFGIRLLFASPKSIAGARVYSFRMILHDWLVDKAQEILKNTILAMCKGHSKILINEMVTPDIDSTQGDTQWDLTMPACLSAMERAE